MTIRPFLLSAVVALAASGCGGSPAPADPHDHDHATPAADAGPVTEAVYGDEAPVEIAPPSVDDHGHEHGHDHDHDHEDEPHEH